MIDVSDEIGPHEQRLLVDAGSPAVRIDVLDHRYRLVASGYGRVDEKLPTGIYTVRYLAANARAERSLVLLPEEPQEVLEPPELLISSPAPLDFTSTSNEYHQAQAVELSREQPLVLGQGTELFLFVRDVEPLDESNPALGLSLHRHEASTALDQDLAAVLREKGNGLAASAGRNIALDPGFYLLRLRLDEARSIQMALHLLPGWQHQLFLLRQGGGFYPQDKPLPDLPGATQLMTRPDFGFAPHRVRRPGDFLDPTEDVRLMELACSALLQNRADIPALDLSKMLNGKWFDPLLAIVGLHLLLMTDEPDLDLAQSVEARLSQEIFGAVQPDVQILRTEIKRRLGLPLDFLPLDKPPMLSRSWDLLIRHSAEWPDIIPPGSLCDNIVGRQWRGGVWLIWEEPRDERGSAGRVIEQLWESASGYAVSLSNTLWKAPVLGRRSAPRVRDLVAGSPLLQWYLAQTPGIGQYRVDSTLPLDLSSFQLRDAAALKEALTHVMNELRGNLDWLTAEPAQRNFLGGANLTEAESALWLYLITLLDFSRWRRRKSKTDPLSQQTLVGRLGLPATHVAAAARGLITKLVQYDLRQRANRHFHSDMLGRIEFQGMKHWMRESQSLFGDAQIGDLIQPDNFDTRFDSSGDQSILLQQERTWEPLDELSRALL